MDSTTWTLPTQEAVVAEDTIVVLLYEPLRELTDPRRGQGKRYQFALILRVLVLAKLAGQQTLSAATEWLRHRRQILAQRFGLSRSKCPVKRPTATS